MSTNTQPQTDGSIDRRTFMKTVGVGAGGLAVGASGVGPSPVGESEAFLPAVGPVIVGALAGGALGFMIEEEYNVLSGDAPPDSLGPEALKDQIAQTVATRKSTNQSTILDNNNILSYIEEPAFVDGKIAAVEAINAGKKKSEVQSAGEVAVNEHIATVEKNLLKTWNESLSELSSMVSAVNEAGLSIGNFFDDTSLTNDIGTLTTNSREISLSDGSTLSVSSVYMQTINNSNDTAEWDPTEMITFSSSSGGSPSGTRVAYIGTGSTTEYLGYAEWNGIWTEIQNVKQNVVDNLALWVDTAYDNVSSGDLNPDELLTPTDLVDQYPGENSLAIAHLQALNVPNAGDNEVQIRVSDQYNTTMQGLLAYSEGLSSELSEGDVIDPNATDSNGDPVYPGDFYISHNLSSWSADVTSKYDTQYGIQSGEIHATSNPKEMYGNPVEGILNVVNTPAGVAQIPVSDFSQTTDNSGNTIWTANISDQLSQEITDITDVSAVVSEEAKGANKYRTEIIETQFEILQTQNGPISFEKPREPQTDSNYIDKSEWDNFEQQTRENVEAWRDSQSPSVPGFGDLSDGLFGLSERVIGLFIAVVVGLFALNAASN